MQGQGYTVPFGADAGGFLQGMNEMRDGTQDTLKAVQDANKGMQSAFNDTGKAADNLGAKFEEEADKIVKLQNAARSLGRELGDAFKGNKVTPELKSKIEGLQDTFKALQKNAKIDVQLDAAKLAVMQNELSKSSKEWQDMEKVIKEVKQSLSTMDTSDPFFKELGQHLQVAEGFFEELNASVKEGDVALENYTKSLVDTTLSFEEVYGELQPLQTRLGEVEDRLYELALAGKSNTDEFKELQKEAIRFRQTIQQVDAQVDTFAKGSAKIDIAVEALTGLAGGFAAVQGAAALFGSENEEVARVIEKVTGAMAILQGIQAVAATFNKDSAVSAFLLARANQSAAASTTALAAATVGETVATEGAIVATNTWTAALLANPIVAVAVAVAAITVAIIAFVAATDDAEEAVEDLNTALDRNRKYLEIDMGVLQRRTALMAAQAKAAGASESEIQKVQGQGLAKEINTRRSSLEELRKLYNERVALRSTEPEDIKRLGDQILAEEENLRNKENELEISRLEYQKQAADDQKEARDKRLEEMKKAAEEEKKLRDQILKFTRDAEDAQLAAMEEGAQKDKAAAQLRTARKLQELNSEVALSKEAAEIRKRAISQIENQLAIELANIDKEAAEKRAQLRAEGIKSLAELQEEGLDRDLDLLNLEHAERRKQIEENYKNETDLREQLLAALQTNFTERRAKIIQEADAKALDEQERAATAQVELLYAYAEQGSKAEEAKQQDILRVQIKYAELRLQALRDAGESEGGAAVSEARATIAKLNAELEKAVKSSSFKKFDILEIMGLGDLSEKQKEALRKSFKSLADSIGQITDALEYRVNKQLEESEKIIDQYDTDIDKLEDKLDVEKDLRDKGLANNAAAVEKELEMKKAAREEEIKQAEELQKKKANIQRAQLAIDSIAQVSNLITAASEIYAVLASLGPFGVGLATATIGLMIGSFLAAKITAFDAVNASTTTYGEGGEIDGKSHAQGGVKYRAVDGSGNIVELEGGEYVVRASSTSKYRPLIDAINKNTLGDMSRDEMADMMASFGISLMPDAVDEALAIVNGNENKASFTGYTAYGGMLDKIGEDVSFLAQRKREEVHRWEDDKYYYSQQGSKLVKIKKYGK